MIAGRLSKANINTMLSGNIVKRQLGFPLTLEEQDAEDQLKADERS